MASTPPGPLPSPADVAARAELQRKIANAVDALQEPYRSVIIHRYFDDLTPTAIAAKSGIPLKTVTSRLYRALAHLRAQLDAEHGGDRKAWSVLILPIAHTATTAPAIATSTWTSLLGFTMKKTLILVVGAAITVLFLWSNHDHRRSSDEDRASTNVAHDGTTPPIHVTSQNDAPASDSDAPSSKIQFVGRVVNPDGAGVPDAQVFLLYVRSTSGFAMPHDVLRRERERRETPVTRTDATGHFTMTRPYPTHSCLRVVAKGYAPAFAGPVAPGTSTTITVRDQNGVVVRVRTSDGRPLAGADVRIETAAMDLQRRGDARQCLAAARTGLDGVARLPVAPKHRFLLAIDPGRYDLGYVEKTYDASKGSIDITVPAVPTRSVRLVDADSGVALEGGYIIIGSSRGPTSWDQEIARRRFKADKNGVVHYPNQDGYYGRFVTAPGYEILPLDRNVMPLRRAMQVRGIVLDPSGRPVANAPIFVAGLSSVFEAVFVGRPPVAAWSGSDGRFAFELKLLTAAHFAVPDPGTRTLVALLPRHAPAVAHEVAVRSGGDIAVELRARAAARLTIKLLGRNGASIEAQLTRLRLKIPRADSWSSVQPNTGVDTLSLATSTPNKTDAHGRIDLAPLAPGDYELWIQHTKRTVSLKAGEHKTLEIPWGSGDAVYGQIVDAGGAPVRNMNVGLGGKSSWVLQSDSDGRFRFDEVEPGDYTVSVFGAGHVARLKIPVELNTENTIRMAPGPAQLRLAVSGPAIKHVEYSLTPEQGIGVPASGGWRRLEPDGRTGRVVPPGPGILLARAPGWGWMAVPYETDANVTTEVRFEMMRAGSGTGQVAAPDRREHVRIQFTPELPRLENERGALRDRAIRRTLGQTSTNAKPDADGRFAATDLRPGPYRVRHLVWNPTVQAWSEIGSATIHVESGTTTTIEFLR